MFALERQIFKQIMKEKMSESYDNYTNNKLFMIDIFPTSGSRKYERYVNKGIFAKCRWYV